MNTQARLPLPPGPTGWPVLGSLPQYYRNPMGFYRGLTLDYGPISMVRLGPQHTYFVNDPKLVEELLQGRAKSCVKDMTTRSLRPLIGNGLLVSEGDLWRRQRKFAAQPFAPKRVDTYADTMVDCATRAFATFAEGQHRNFHADSMALTLEIAGKTLLGLETPPEVSRVAHCVEEGLDYYYERLRTWRGVLPESTPTRRRRRLQRSKRELDAIVSAIIARCRAQGAAGDYLLARLIRARTEDGEPMSEQLLIDEALTMLLAGHETTALALMWSVYLLAKHPDKLAQLQAEVDSVLGSRSVGLHDLPQLPLLDAVIRESLRLYPPAYAIGRESTETFELGGYTIARGVQLIVCPYGIHRNPHWFRDPDQFRPERWQNGETSELPRCAFMPFGGGPRICIGSHFAMLETALVLATLVQHVELTLQPGFKLVPDPIITLRSKHGLPVIVKRRTSGAVLPVRSQSQEETAPADLALCPHAVAIREPAN